MKKLLHKLVLVLLFLPSFLLSQTQIGSDIVGDAAGDRLGQSVSLSSDGSIMAIGAIDNDENGTDSGHVRIYENENGTWTQIGSDIDGEAAGDQSGQTVSLSSDGSIVAIGAPGNDDNVSNSGHVRVYENVNDNWTQIGSDIDGEAEDDGSDLSVSLSSDGSIVAIGARHNDGNGQDSGHVRIYKNVSGVWTQIGSDIDGEAEGDYFGTSVSLSSDGNIVAIGAHINDGNGYGSGHVRIYQNVSGTWTQVGQDIDGEAEIDFSGYSVSLSSDGSIVAIGAPNNHGENGEYSGHVRIYENVNDNWTQIGSDIDGEAADDNSGIFVSLSSDGSIVAIGARYNDGNETDSGHVRIYKNVSGVWTQVGTDIDGEAENDYSGEHISLSSDASTVAIGAAFNDGNGEDSGHVRVYDVSALTLNVDRQLLETITIYPNPTSDYVNLALPSSLELEKVVIYNSLGQLVSAQKEAQVNLSNYAQGVYYIELITTQGKIVKQFIKE